jgi:hypothetical protein
LKLCGNACCFVATIKFQVEEAARGGLDSLSTYMTKEEIMAYVQAEVTKGIRGVNDRMSVFMDQHALTISATDHQQSLSTDEILALLVDRKLDRLGIDLESRLEKKLDRKVATATERKLKVQQADLELSMFKLFNRLTHSL